MTDRRHGEGAPGSVGCEAGVSRTSVAGRNLLNAIHADLLDLRRRAEERKARRWSAKQSAPSEGSLTEDSARKPGILRRVLIGVGTIALLVVITIAGVIAWSLHNLPLDHLNAEAESPAIVIEAADGSPLGRVGTLKTPDAKRSEFPKQLIDAVLSVEDRRFYSHHGVDPRGIIRALRRNMEAGTIVEGGSTITQQLVRMLYLGSERTYTRKLQEAITAIWLEGKLSKEEILTRYLNSIYLGANARGMPAAARIYFDKNLSELTIAEAAMLAGLIRAPSLLNPLRSLEAARERANVVLDAMVATGSISEAEANAARAEPARLNRPEGASVTGSWFADWAAEEASRLAGSFSGNLKVRTTLVPELQALAEAAVAELLADGSAHGISQVALIAMRPDGAVVAMIGGRDYRASQFNRATQALRQPGSAFKLFVYLAALRHGYEPSDVIDAGPVEIDGWKPENFLGEQDGAMTLADAFANSVNTASVRLALDVGLERVIASARDLGIDGPLPAHPSLALGAAELSLLDLTGAFASVRFGATPVEPYGIAAFGGEDQSRLYTITPSTDNRKPLGPERAKLIDLLQQVVQRGTARQAALDGFAAGKTGTSENYRDAWFIGFTEDLVAGVWVGNDDGAPMDKVTGGSVPAMIWQRFMTGAKPIVRQETPVMASADPQSDPSWAFERAAGVPAPASCNILACSKKYRSFRGEDCTYQPYSGGRRLCEIGRQPATGTYLTESLSSETNTSPEDSGGTHETINDAPLALLDNISEPLPTKVIVDTPLTEEEIVFEPPADAAASRICDLAACAAKYNSFNAADCTFQPFGGGPRQLCEMEPGGPVALDPPADAPDPLRYAEPALSGKGRPLSGEPKIVGVVPENGESIVIIEEFSAKVASPDACNVAACAAEYNSFRAADCSYQPFDGGPRQSCQR